MFLSRSFFVFISSLILLFISLSTPLTASAAVDILQFDTDSQRQRYHALIEVLRCPKCQNQNLAGSNSEIAADLRRELHRLLLEGQSDTEIKGYMVERYGDFVLYKPPLNSSTIALWLFPVVLLFGGAIALLLIIRQRADPVANETDKSLSEEEQQQLDVLLSQSESSGEPVSDDTATSVDSTKNINTKKEEI